MDDALGVTPDGLRGVGVGLGDASAQVKAVLAGLDAKLAAEGQPWGNDAIGDQFAKGPSGYVAQRDWVNGSVGAKTDLLDGYAGSMHDTADTLEGQDQR